MIVQMRAGSIILRAETATEERAVPLAGISPVAITIDRKGQWLAASALPPGGKARSIHRETAYRGDFRLFVCDIDDPAWRLLDQGFAADPVWFPNSERVAFSTTSGPAVAELSTGNVIRTKVGRLDWGPSAISVNGSGSQIAFVKWRSDHQMLGVWNLGTNETRIFPTSCFRYSWWTDDTLLFQLGGPPRLLDTNSGQTSTLAPMRQLLEAIRPVAESELERLPRNAPTWDPVSGIGWSADVLASGHRVFLKVHVSGTPGGGGIFSLSRNLEDPVLHAWFADWRVTGYVIADTPGLFSVRLERGSGRDFEWRQTWAGAGSDAIGEDWLPLPREQLPEFGFLLS